MLFSIIFWLLVAIFLIDFIWTHITARQRGYRTLWLGVPIFYSVPYLVRNYARLMDIAVEQYNTSQEDVICAKRSFGGGFTIFSVNPAINDHILSKNFENYELSNIRKVCLKPLLGQGIFNVDGAKWLDQRKVSSHMFAKKEVKQMIDVFVEHFESLSHYLEKNEGKVVEMHDVWACYTLDCFAKVAFQIDVNSLNSESPFKWAFNEAQNSSSFRFRYYPFWQFLPKKFFWLEQTLEQAVKVLDDLCYGLVKDRLKDGNLEERADLISKYVTIQRNQKQNGLAKDEVEITDRYIRDVMLNFILAGRDTTAQTLLWSFYLLSLPENKQVKENLRKDALSLNGKIDYESVLKLDYVERFVFEVLRLYPPVPNDGKVAVEDDILPGGYVVKKGDEVSWSQNGMGRSTKYFDCPLEVRPDRWLGEEYNGGKKIEKFKHAFIPFQNGGRRVCMGQQMALLEAKAVLCMMLPKFDLELVPGQNIQRIQLLTIFAKDGIKFIPRKIK